MYIIPGAPVRTAVPLRAIIREHLARAGETHL